MSHPTNSGEFTFPVGGEYPRHSLQVIDAEQAFTSGNGRGHLRHGARSPV